nr:hypothetical protein [Tilapia lake virus]
MSYKIGELERIITRKNTLPKDSGSQTGLFHRLLLEHYSGASNVWFFCATGFTPSTNGTTWIVLTSHPTDGGEKVPLKWKYEVSPGLPVRRVIAQEGTAVRGPKGAYLVKGDMHLCSTTFYTRREAKYWLCAPSPKFPHWTKRSALVTSTRPLTELSRVATYLEAISKGATDVNESWCSYHRVGLVPIPEGITFEL